MSGEVHSCDQWALRRKPVSSDWAKNCAREIPAEPRLSQHSGDCFRCVSYAVSGSHNYESGPMTDSRKACFLYGIPFFWWIVEMRLASVTEAQCHTSSHFDNSWKCLVCGLVRLLIPKDTESGWYTQKMTGTWQGLWVARQSSPQIPPQKIHYQNKPDRR